MITKDIFCNTCHYLNQKGWMPGNTGTLILSQKTFGDSHNIFVTPSSVSKRDIKPSDLFEIRVDNLDLSLNQPSKLSTNGKTHTTPLLFSPYIKIIQTTNIKCILEIKTSNSILISKLAIKLWETNGDSFPDKIKLGSFFDIELPEYINILQLEEVESKISKLAGDPLLIRDYGLIIFGDSLESVKIQADHLDLIFKIRLEEFRLSLV